MTKLSPESGADGPGGERRRSKRVLIRFPIHITGENRSGERIAETAEAVVISRHGALIRTTSEPRPGSVVEVENPSNHLSARFKVVWTMEKPEEGKWDVGLELREGSAEVWGVEFPATLQ